ncbi:MAG: hypothetical protein JXR91_02225, partial [Deltaproteobacteria bacterium]|nr:hypothetical protein [Deltaproteobacteria bacterium]
FKLAREQFFKFTGKFDESEPWFEVRMSMFMDWYLLDRKDRSNLTPVERYILNNSGNEDPETMEQLRYFLSTQRSVFRIEKIDGVNVMLKDLIRGGLWLTEWTLPIAGLQTDRIINTRIIYSKGTVFAGRGAVLHPREAKESILSIIDRALAEHMPPEHITSYMDKINLKLNRYSNVKIKHVYQYPSDAVF